MYMYRYTEYSVVVGSLFGIYNVFSLKISFSRESEFSTLTLIIAFIILAVAGSCLSLSGY